MKRPFFAIVTTFFLSMSINVTAHAFDLSKFIDDSNQDSYLNNDLGLQKVSDGKFYFLKDTGPDSKWVMLNIVKEDHKEQILLPVINEHVSMKLYLRYGTGIYDISVAESKFEGKYEGSYYVGKDIKVENTDDRDLSFLLPSEYVQSDNVQIIALAQLITKDAVDDVDAIRKIHKYIATNIKYDYDSYYDGSYASKPFDAISTLKNLKAVCAGYSDLYATLARAAGIRAKVIYGIGNITKNTTGSHAWNEVFVNNEWKSVDVTWDSTTGRMFKYFDITEEVFDQDHQKQTEQVF
jgi:hypothetical protein